MGLDLQSFFEFAATVEDLHRVEEDEDSERGEPILEKLPQDPALAPDVLCAAVENRDRLHHAMGFLKAEQRRVLRLYYFEEQTMAEIARAMRLTESRISQIHSRALEELAYILTHGRPRRVV